MTNDEILAALKVGDIVTNKQVLAAMKKSSLIYDYSEWGYLESGRIYYETELDGRKTTDHIYVELISGKEARDIIDNRQIMIDAISARAYTPKLNEVVYRGCIFGTEYLSGCFQPYLIYKGRVGEEVKQVSPNKTMTFFGKLM